ncbi:ABC transporter substrate-binding protein [Haloferax mediterranei ATCC 33500]|uniref:ABC transporter substrate-binding protein n=1 Tax=Haloferax mediterranei (strain ATCC 33500 / DSM 1411 / JCM 8866 / NBRC 14739 / NCIMB 2177 / R-4) TaxID=523841 RepID=I3R5L9_HALMT|nr:ABC transporter substrate-binding protein [Haloferax mediterranei]AFK19529.1 branched-chain/neutral amino acids amide ABC transporter periplasmic substrate-binding protein [Haloferax mediterranei ATCC 33500]AHZ22925.1 ABC transporter substrate-binding protein [Haloferax mediterranei ATCC 33500]ELZ99850.1 branched-chain/neutral amino acids amide ABC transporter periplasmic substrate-binding protein [Haloferax mediterranei ATCC 33500]MDX5987728.1 ABC transporter substrate-binding protein [Halo
MLKAIGGTALAASLAGCSALVGDDEPSQSGESADVPDKPIQAGLQTFTEGAAAVLGLQTQYGAELAVQRINEAGGIAGREITLEVVEEADAHVENYKQFVDEGKDVTFGPISSGGHAALAPEVENQGVVNVGTDGTVTTLYEETVPDPTYSFRFQNHDVMECVAAARAAVTRLGADNIDTIAGINPNYAFGKDEFGMFKQAIQKLTGAEVVYEGYPDLLAEDMSTHITEVNNNQPDVTFSSNWGGDATTLLNQGAANNMFENTRLVGSVLYSAVNDLSKDVVEQANAVSGSRNFYWGEPTPSRWKPGKQLLTAARDQWDIVPSAHFMSGYGAVTAWATAAEKAVELAGGWPSQEQIARALEGHGFYTPAGYHVMGMGHQGLSNAYYGDMVWDDDLGAPALENVTMNSPPELAPPPGVTASDWISSW